MKHFAHSLKGQPEERWQLLAEHLEGTARLAELRGAKFGMASAAYVAGLLHDLGKYTEGFQRRLHGGERVDHATAGAQMVRDLAGPHDRVIAELLAYAIAGHHAGLPNRQGDRSGTLERRLSKELEPLSPIWREEVGPVPEGLTPEQFSWHPDPKRRPFQLAMLCRFLFSCLVDADYRDTEAFYAVAEGREVERGVVIPLADLSVRLDDYLTKLGRRDSEIGRLRTSVLNHTRAQAMKEPGLFSLTVPTGGGKTLSSLAFALDHALHHGQQRIIYAIPFTSVIDQTAAIFRDALGDQAVLAHHGAIDETEISKREGVEKLRLAMEDWSVPVVVTTNVQLFESLFSNRPSRCRKLHNIVKSVIVLDEAQTIPLHVLKPCVAAVDELARNYGASVVLCTATQPALQEPNFKGGFSNVRELAPEPRELQKRLVRVTFEVSGEFSDGRLVDALAEHEQALIIVNSRKHALALYRTAQAAGLPGLVHLTTRMTAAHRSRVLESVRSDLKAGAPCRLIATSLIEAGVDVDFPRVWRAEAGLDSMLQAAGRCNREGQRPRSESAVTLFEAPDWPPPREVAAFAKDMGRIIKRHDDISSLAAIEDYFGEVYWRKGPEALDRDSVMARFLADKRGTDFAFQSVAEGFRLIESRMAPVIVPQDPASRKAIADLGYAERSGHIARKLQAYIVQVPPRDRAVLLKSGRVQLVSEDRFGDQFVVLQDESLYQENVGLLWEEAESLDIDNLLF